MQAAIAAGAACVCAAACVCRRRGPKVAVQRVEWTAAEVHPRNAKDAAFRVIADAASQQTVPFVVRDARGAVFAQGDVAVGATTTVDLAKAGFGTYTVEVRAPDGAVHAAGVVKKLQPFDQTLASTAQRPRSTSDWPGRKGWETYHLTLPPASDLPVIPRAVLRQRQARLASAESADEDVYIAVRGKVYSVTAFAQVHPGGRRALLMSAQDGDATAAFERVHPHVDADDVLGRCCVGVLAKDEDEGTRGRGCGTQDGAVQ
eukprot:TRINITY_DN11421_c0_g1_i1.p2 TRINITY_DN11421_c0_g1~~TRINITY_DN11421_c0_g1_i1.p2  ORF type:complete len:274 (+),score=75.87 TRINITY_DN11421_c0_g1_i1:45-824(+)